MSQGGISILEAAKTAAGELIIPQPEFAHSIGWAADYQSLFSQTFTRTTGIDVLLADAFTRGRVLLAGRGGSGKTIILRRLAKIAADEGMLPIVIELKRWTALDYEQWKELDREPSARSRLLLERFASPAVSPLQLDLLDPSLRKLVLVDGLNEVALITGQTILFSLDDLVRDLIRTAVIVTDRVVRRTLRSPEHWRLAFVMPLAPAEVVRVLDAAPAAAQEYKNASASARGLLETPFFLDDALRRGAIEANVTSVLRSFLLQHAVSESEEAAAARAAFEVYDQRSRTFLLSVFRISAGPEVTEKLMTSGLLQMPDGEHAVFWHHLMHDFLAAQYLARTPQLWTYKAFNRVSFFASSFDTLAMVMDLVEPGRVDRLARALYDWNPYAVAYAVAESEKQGSGGLSIDVKRVMWAAMVEKRFDIIETSAQTASDALAVSSTDEATALLRAADLPAALEIVKGWTSAEEWFLGWRALFIRDPKTSATDEDLEALRDVDSIVGWTLANVLRRAILTEKQQTRLREMFGQTVQSEIRWRIVHVIGWFPTRDNALFLLDALREGSVFEIRLGAVRAIIEVAARASEDVREVVFKSLIKEVPWFLENPRLLRLLENYVFIDRSRAPHGWKVHVIALVRALYVGAPSLEEQQRWLSIASELEKAYAD